MPETAKPASDRTPLAIALRYDGGNAPRVVAKGRGAMADAIIAKARDSGVMIEEDPLMAEALASVELDVEIPVELFEAVAVLISFVLSARKDRTPL